jgi:hypothetical protein
MGWLREPDPDAVATPPLLMAFDLLYQDRRDLTLKFQAYICSTPFAGPPTDHVSRKSPPGWTLA